ncbi:MAG: EAL domain-containing response regulator [Pseudomonadota bacterium]
MIKPPGRLLILDDDAAVGQTLSAIAQAHGFDARYAADAEVFFREQAVWKPSHIALDLMMPGMDGIEVIRRLAVIGCDARVIITSGVGQRVLDAARRSATEHGLDIAGVLPKPFSPSDLRALLGAHGGDTAAPKKPSVTPSFKVTAAALRAALSDHQFRVAYQPKIECVTGVVAGFEALVRWHHPQTGVIMPDDFIPLAEANGLIAELTGQVFEEAFQWLTKNHPGSGVGLSLNLSARSLAELDLADRLYAQCQRFAIEPQRVILEVTESSAMEDPQLSLDLLTRFRVKGFQLSIDDFGTGFSSMVQLVRLPFSELKIDKSFVTTATTSQESRAVIKCIVDLGHALGLKVTAEGVEDLAVLEYLKSVHCDLAQGFFISRAMAGDVVAGWMAQWQQDFAALLQRKPTAGSAARF